MHKTTVAPVRAVKLKPRLQLGYDIAGIGHLIRWQELVIKMWSYRCLPNLSSVCRDSYNSQPLREGASSPVSFYSANLLSRLTFWYFNAVVKRGKKKPLENEDLPEVDHAVSLWHILLCLSNSFLQDLTQRWGERLQAAWDEEAVK